MIGKEPSTAMKTFLKILVLFAILVVLLFEIAGDFVF